MPMPRLKSAYAAVTGEQSWEQTWEDRYAPHATYVSTGDKVWNHYALPILCILMAVTFFAFGGALMWGGIPIIGLVVCSGGAGMLTLAIKVIVFNELEERSSQ